MSKLIDAIKEGLNLHNGNIPKHDNRILPVCTMEDLEELGHLLREFNGSSEFVEVYASAGTSEGYIDFAEENPEYRPNSETQIKIVCNALPGPFMRRFKPGYLRATQMAIAEGTEMPKYNAGKLYPLSCDGFLFGVLLVTDEQYNPSRPKPQFGIIMSVRMKPEIDIEELSPEIIKAITGNRISNGA